MTVFQSISGRLPERGRKRRERIEDSKNVQTNPIRTYWKHNRPLAYYHPNCRTPRHWKFTQDLEGARYAHTRLNTFCVQPGTSKSNARERLAGALEILYNLGPVHRVPDSAWRAFDVLVPGFTLFVLTHFRPVYLSILIIWTSQFLSLAVSRGSFILLVR